MQIILLAAGMGIRLGHLTRVAPKALVPLNDQLLIDYTLSVLVNHPKVEEVLLVGGFEHALLEQHIASRYADKMSKIKLLENKNYTLGNYYSLATALPYVKKDFLITNVDHVFSAKTWDFILQKYQGVTVFADFEREFLEDEMKISLGAQKNLKHISKTLLEFEAAYVGLTFVSQMATRAYLQAAREAELTFGDKAVAENVLALLAQRQEEIQVIPFDAHTWYEVDTPQDLHKAEQGLREEAALMKRRI